MGKSRSEIMKEVWRKRKEAERSDDSSVTVISPTWEYQVLVQDANISAPGKNSWLNELGREGWELVRATAVEYIFKREIYEG